jgi:hypothetical protein
MSENWWTRRSIVLWLKTQRTKPSLPYVRTRNPFVIALDANDAAALTLDYVITRLLKEETHILGLSLAPKIPVATSRHPANEAMAATESTGRHPFALSTCISCGNKGHYQRSCLSKSTFTADAALQSKN